MSITPFFSVVIPSYNRAHLLPRAIESILSQTYDNWELIIVDDASTDETPTLLQSYTDSRIRFIRNETNLERSASRNIGIEAARGQYICFLDSDDIFLPERLLLLKTEIDKRDRPVCMIFTDLIYDNGLSLTYSDNIIAAFKTVYDFLANTIIGVPQVCIHNNILQHIRFNPAYHIAEDLDLWLRIARKYPLIYPDNKKTIMATMHDDRSVNERKYNSGAAQLKVLKDIFKSDNFGRLISPHIKKRRFGDTYFSISRHYMYNKKPYKAIGSILKSLFFLPFHTQTIHKLYIMAHLTIGKIPKEYR